MVSFCTKLPCRYRLIRNRGLYRSTRWIFVHSWTSLTHSCFGPFSVFRNMFCFYLSCSISVHLLEGLSLPASQSECLIFCNTDTSTRCVVSIISSMQAMEYDTIYTICYFFLQMWKLPFLRSTLVKDIREVPVLYCHRRTIKLQKFQALKHHEIYAGAQTICLQIITKLLLEYDECMQRYGRGHEWNDCISYILHLRNELWMENQNSLIFQMFAKVSLLFLYKALRGRFVPQLVVFHQILTLLATVLRDCSLNCSKIRSFLAILSFSNPFSSFS